MKKSIKIVATCFAIMPFLGACKKSFIEIQPNGSTVLESNYYKNAAEVLTGLIATYDPLGSETGSTYSDKVGLLNAASDDCGAGGGSRSDQIVWSVWDDFTLTPAQGPSADQWGRNYTGIYRANLLLSKIDAPIPGLSDALKARYAAEMKFLRAYYYFDLVRLFKNVPLITGTLSTTAIYSQNQATPEAVYAQIEQDLQEAIAEPNFPDMVPADSEGGRATRGAAKALLGKVFLYEQKWADAATQLADVNGTPGGTSSFGYHLLTSFPDIFNPVNKFNTESIFEIVHTSQARQDWGSWGSFEGNIMVQMVGPRNYSGPTYVSGYGFNPITQSLVDAIRPDPRYPFTLANIDSIANAGGSYDADGQYQNTGFFVEKYAPKVENRSSLGGIGDLNYPNDYIEIRLADTYLMEAEALMQSGGGSRAQELLDAVRARVGLGSVPVSLPAIYSERRLELATEGHRFFDLVRWGQAGTVLAPYGFTPGKNEILPIPLGELSNTQLVQNPNY